VGEDAGGVRRKHIKATKAGAKIANQYVAKLTPPSIIKSGN
jgi:hypothetical protein